MQNKKSAFSLVEIIIAIAIITLLAVIGMSYNQGYKDKTDNTKIVSDIETINNALESYAQDNSSLPMPGGNTNFFKIDTSYSHSYTGSETFGVYGSITEDTLPKKYLDVLPLDPRTNSYYSYGKTGENVDKLVANQFELASVQNIDGEYQAKVSGNYTAEAGPYNLIREYNGSNFVYDKSKSNLPYNPEELILIATAGGEVYRENDTIEATSGDLEIFFSDGSVSVLEDGGELTLDKLSFPNKNNLNTFVKLSLGAGTIWTKATHLNDGSEFEVYTTDSTAAVRGTIFGVRKDSLTAPTEVFVVEGEVEVYKNDEQKTKIIDLIKDESTSTKDGTIFGTTSINISDYDSDKFGLEYDDIRDDETVAMINKEIIERENENNIISDVDTGVVVPNCTDGVITTTVGNLITTVTCASNVETTNYNCISGFHIVGGNACEADCTFLVDGIEMCNEELAGMPLLAYAPYNVKGNILLYKNGGEFPYNQDSIIGVSSANDLPYYCADNALNKYDSFCIDGTTKGIILDNDINNDDYIKYSNLGLNHNENFAIEMNVKVPTDTSTTKHYLLHSGNTDIGLYIQNGKLFYSTSPNYVSLNMGVFNKIILENNSGVMTAKKEGQATSISKTLTNNIDFLYVGAMYINSTTYINQINDIIDYVKIYKN